MGSTAEEARYNRRRPMPRSKSSDAPLQRQSLRVPIHMKTTASAESKLDDRRRSLPEVGVCRQKKQGTRASDLEARLGHANSELKKLKEQLASAENAKRDAEQELDETKKLMAFNLVQQEEERDGGVVEEVINPVPEEPEIAPTTKQQNEGVKLDDPNGGSEEDESSLAVEDKMEREEDEIRRYIAENAALRKELEELKEAAAAAAKSREEEMRSLEEELVESRGKLGGVEERLRAEETEKEQLETEVERVRVQAEQWRKAADAAAAIMSEEGVLGMGVGAGRRMPERCRSTDKQHGGGLSSGSPTVSGRRRSGGFGMLGALWKKKMVNS